jgi:saccharopine dehydrogenase-like NADP-dependent oxidoreductase
MKKVAVFGCGLVGKTIVEDLSNDYKVKAIDPSQDALDKITGVSANIELFNDYASGEAIRKCADDCDCIVGALPSKYGYPFFKDIVAIGNKNYLDISFMKEDLWKMDSLHASYSSTKCIVDFGVAPGFSNLVFGHMLKTMKKMDKYIVTVGGVPQNPQPPWYYKATWSPEDIIEEYVRPARIVRDHKVVELPALSEPEKFSIYYAMYHGGDTNLDGVSFLTDGSRSLLRFADRVSAIEERTLRHVGHYNAIKQLKDMGFLLERENGISESPLHVTTHLFGKGCKTDESFKDKMIMQINIIGSDYIKDRRAEIRLEDVYDENTKTTAMARCTGYMATAGSRLLVEKGDHIYCGVHYPEDIGMNIQLFEFVLDHLRDRGIKIS